MHDSLLLECIQTHGSLNVCGWGLLLPLGAMVARYAKNLAAPAWFYVHMVLQLSGYIVGTIGFGYGIQLWHYSDISSDSYHGNMGIAVFALATAQVSRGRHSLHSPAWLFPQPEQPETVQRA